MKFTFLIISICICFKISGQNPVVTVEDYQRAQFFADSIRNLVYNVYVTPHWFANSTGFWYEIEGKESKSFRRIDFPAMEARPAFDHERLVQALSKVADLQLVANNLPLENIDFEGKDTLAFSSTRRAATMRRGACCYFPIFTKWRWLLPAITITGWKKLGDPRCIWAGQ